MALIAATGLLAAGVLTGGFDRMALRSSAKELTAQLRFARAHAIATGVPQRFTVDPAAHAWQGANGRGGFSWYRSAMISASSIPKAPSPFRSSTRRSQAASSVVFQQ